MEERICYFNNDYVKESDAKVSISDWGIWEGGVYDVARTYNHVPFKLEEHVDRIFRSLRGLPFIKFNRTREEVIGITLELIKRNEKNIDPRDDCRIIYRISRGVCFSDSTDPTFFVHLVPYGPARAEGYQWMSESYEKGVRLVVANTRQIPVQCLDPKIKHSNRLCNRLAQYEAHMIDPGAVALILNINGHAMECPRDNFFMVANGTLFTSRLIDCLPGIVRDTVIELAGTLNIACVEKDITVYDLYQSDEMMLTNSSIAIFPVSKFNERVMPAPIPGPVTRQLMQAYSNLVDYDIVERTRENYQAGL
ncbi:MAG: aminotransferase class IV [Deltaproteobacteria bacterium]|nr:aminotransferase class IV [Deltaproteobacteria bacterium]